MKALLVKLFVQSIWLEMTWKKPPPVPTESCPLFFHTEVETWSEGRQ